MLVITKKVDPLIFEGILGCFFGMVYLVNDLAQLYYSYELLQYLGIEELKLKVHVFLIDNVKAEQFLLIGVQISELYQEQELSQAYYNYFNLSEEPFTSNNPIARSSS